MLVSNLAELNVAMAAAVGGEVIELTPGNYGSAWFTHVFPTPVTIVSQDPANPAVFTELAIDGGATNIILDSLYFRYTYVAGDPEWIKPFEINDAFNITIRNSIFEGDEIPSSTGGSGNFGTGIGLNMVGNDGVTIEFCEVYNFWTGIGNGHNSNITVRGCDLHDMSTDALVNVDVKGLLIEGNYLHDLKRDFSTGNHADMIQLWDTQGGQWTEDMTIRGNFIDVGITGVTQSIFLKNESWDGVEYHRNFLIEDNVIYNAHTHGITVDWGGFDGVVIRNNTVLYNPHAIDPNTPGGNTPFINVKTEDHLNVTVTGNVVGKTWNWDAVMATPGWTTGNNLMIQYDDPVAANYYGGLFVNPFAVNATLADLRALAGGLIELAGVGAAMTRMDIPMNAGPNGTVAPASDPPPPDPDPTPPPPDPDVMVITDLDVVLIDADTNLVIQPLVDGALVEPAVLAFGVATIAVEAAAGAPAIGSVRLTIGPYSRLESASPYALFGDDAGNFTGGLVLDDGPWVLRLEVYSAGGGGGDLLGDFAVNFTVGVEAPPAPDPIDPAVQAALDVMNTILAGVVAETSELGSDVLALGLSDDAAAIERAATAVTLTQQFDAITSLQTAIALGVAERAALSLRMLSVEAEAAAALSGLSTAEAMLLVNDARLTAGAAGLAGS